MSESKEITEDEDKEKELKELKSIDGMEVFSAGTWNGDKYTIKDIDEMVAAFNETKSFFKPKIKLGHNKEQQLLQKDGLPNAGLINNLYRKGEKLLADVVKIPKKVAELIDLGGFPDRSSEIYWDIKLNGNPFKRVLSAVSLLGTEMPAVQNLSDILALYGLDNYDGIKSYAQDNENYTVKILSYDIGKEKTMEKTEKEVKLESKVETLEDQAKNYSTDIETKDAEIAELKDYKIKFEESETKAKRAEFTVTVESLETSKATKNYILETKKEDFSLDELKEILKLHSHSDVNLEESSIEGDKEDKKGEAALDAKINKYAKDNDISYRDAYTVVMNEEK